MHVTKSEISSLYTCRVHLHSWWHTRVKSLKPCWRDGLAKLAERRPINKDDHDQIDWNYLYLHLYFVFVFVFGDETDLPNWPRDGQSIGTIMIKLIEIFCICICILYLYLYFVFVFVFVFVICPPGTSPKLSFCAGGGGGDGSSTRLIHIIRRRKNWREGRCWHILTISHLTPVLGCLGHL